MSLTETQQKIRRKAMVYRPDWGIFVDQRTMREVEESRRSDMTWPISRKKKKANAARKAVQRLKNLQARRERNQGKK